MSDISLTEGQAKVLLRLRNDGPRAGWEMYRIAKERQGGSASWEWGQRQLKALEKKGLCYKIGAKRQMAELYDITPLGKVVADKFNGSLP